MLQALVGRFYESAKRQTETEGGLAQHRKLAAAIRHQTDVPSVETLYAQQSIMRKGSKSMSLIERIFWKVIGAAVGVLELVFFYPAHWAVSFGEWCRKIKGRKDAGK